MRRMPGRVALFDMETSATIGDSNCVQMGVVRVRRPDESESCPKRSVDPMSTPRCTQGLRKAAYNGVSSSSKFTGLVSIKENALTSCGRRTRDVEEMFVAVYALTAPSLR